MRGIVVLWAVVAVLALGACSSSSKKGQTVVNQPSTTTAAAPPTNPPQTGAPTTAAPTSKTAHVGDTVSLAATDQSPPATITLVKIVDPAQGADQFTTPGQGKRFVGVQFRIVLGGTQSTQGSPDNDATVYDSQGQSYSSGFGNLMNCQSFASPLTLSPGEPVLGCITYELPTSAKIAKVKFTPASGFAPATAEWQVP
jgi:hypothetical protein